MKISTAAREYLIEIEVRKFTTKTIRSYRNNLNLFAAIITTLFETGIRCWELVASRRKTYTMISSLSIMCKFPVIVAAQADFRKYRAKHMEYPREHRKMIYFRSFSRKYTMISVIFSWDRLFFLCILLILHKIVGKYLIYIIYIIQCKKSCVFIATSYIFSFYGRKHTMRIILDTDKKTSLFPRTISRS